MVIAVFDLGTNVFNLLIARVSKDECSILKVIQRGSHIGKGGFKNGYLTKDAIDSSIEAMDNLTEILNQQGGATVVKAFATSAIRDASNGEEFAVNLRSRYGIDVEIISGEREAELIYKGVRESLLLYNEKVLVLDIGGGSNEFIIADKSEIYWKMSYPLGVIRIKELINPSDPITREQIDQYKSYLDKSLETLIHQASIYRPKLLIGSSGSFDTLRELIFPGDSGELPAMELPLDSFFDLHQRLLRSTRDERIKMAGMSPMRVDYMVLGSIFAEYVITKLGITELYQSSYSLKEGYMAEVAASMTNY